MGRPLPKRYFGNLNTDDTGFTQATYQRNSAAGIGGQAVASISTATQGSININNSYPHFPTLTVAAPELPGGVTATTATTWEIESITVGGTNTGYTINQTGASAVLTGLSTQASVAPVITINTNGSGNVSAISFAGGRGEWTSIDGTGISTWAITGAGGSNAQATVKFRVKSIAIVDGGAGYVAVPSLTWTTLSGTTPSAQTPTLTTDSGTPYTAEAFPAIIAYGITVGSGSSKISDIVRQRGTRRFYITNADGSYVCSLKGSAAAAQGEMTITATDSSGKTYYVTKLNRHKAVLSQYGSSGWEFADGAIVPWTFDAATLNTTVQIANA